MWDELAVDREKFFAELDQLTESEIEARLATGVWREDKRPLVRAYLEQKKLAWAKAAQADQLEVARSAKDAAWAAVTEAKGANRRATIAIIVSAGATLAAVASVVVAYLAWRS